jgi:signal peptidase I
MVWFEIILVVLTLLSGFIWLLDKLFLAKRRARADGLLADATEPVVVDYARAFFPVLALVLCLRSFVAEPFRIPSSSMMPTLLIGDFILVNKFSYGLRLPITNRKFVELGEPERGDVVVFRYPGNGNPQDPNIGADYIKRVIGLPGDTVEYAGSVLRVNGQTMQYVPNGEFSGTGRNAEMNGVARLIEKFPGHEHEVLERPDGFADPRGEGVWVVPPGHYLVMGDNRDHSDDGRFWGFLSEDRLRGKAFLVWLNCSGWFCRDSFETSRIGNDIP